MILYCPILCTIFILVTSWQYNLLVRCCMLFFFFFLVDTLILAICFFWYVILCELDVIDLICMPLPCMLYCLACHKDPWMFLVYCFLRHKTRKKWSLDYQSYLYPPFWLWSRRTHLSVVFIGWERLILWRYVHFGTYFVVSTECGSSWYYPYRLVALS